MNPFQTTILKRCSYGHLSSSQIPELLEWIPENNSSALSLLDTTRQKVSSVCMEFSGDLTQVTSTLEEFAEQSKEKVLRESIYSISSDLKSEYFHKKIFQKIKSTQRKKDYLINNLNSRFDRVEKKLLEIHKERRQKEYIRRSLNSLISEALLNEHSLPIHLRKKFGDKVYCLTKRGAAYITENIDIPYLSQVRIMKYNEDKAKHELMVSNVIHTLLTREHQDGYVIHGILDETAFKTILGKDIRKLKHLVDLNICIEFNGYSRSFFFEIDNGSQPLSVFDYRVNTYPDLIYICSTKAIAKKYQQRLYHHSKKTKRVLITTFDKFIQNGVLGAGYLTRFKNDFCKCKKLVIFKIGKQSIMRDENGCPCILSSFVQPKSLRKKYSLTKSKKTAIKNPSNHTSMPLRKPPLSEGTTFWEKIKLFWRMFR